MEREILKKVSIKERNYDQTSTLSYLVEDVLSAEKLTMVVPGKMRMNYFKISVGDVLYMVLPDENSKVGKLVYQKYICLHAEKSDLCRQKREIDALEKIK